MTYKYTAVARQQFLLLALYQGIQRGFGEGGYSGLIRGCGLGGMYAVFSSVVMGRQRVRYSTVQKFT